MLKYSLYFGIDRVIHRTAVVLRERTQLYSRWRDSTAYLIAFQMYSQKLFAKLQMGIKPIQKCPAYNNIPIPLLFRHPLTNTNYIFRDNNVSDRSLRCTQNSPVGSDGARVELKLRGREDTGKAMIRDFPIGIRGTLRKKLPRTSNRWYQKFVGEEMYPVRPRL